MLITDSLGIGCTEKAVQVIAKYIDRNLFNVSICCLTRGGIREKEIEKNGIPIFKINGSIDEFRKILRENQIDIIHINVINHDYLKSAKNLVPVIIETSIFGSTSYFNLENKYIDKILFVSKMIAIRYRKLLKLTYENMQTKTHIIYNPIDFNRLKRDFEQKISRIKEKLNINSIDFVMGKIGRRDSSKWSNFIIEMTELLQKKYKNFKVILIGTPSEIMNEIRRKKLERYFILIKFASEENLELFYELIDCLIHSSKMGESFGCTLAEAMAHKKPVIVNATPLKDNAQIEVVDNSKTGFVVDYPETGVQAIMALIRNKNLNNRLGENGFQKAYKQFNAKTLVKYVEKIYITTLYKKNLIDEEFMNNYQNIQINPDMNSFKQFEVEYQLKLNDSYGALSIYQHLKYFIRTLSKLISHFYKNILLPLGLYLLFSIPYLNRKGKNMDISRNTIKSGIIQVNYYLSSILRRKYYEILFI